MKTFTRIEPTTVQEVGDKFKNQVVIKRFQTEDGLKHEFTTFHREGRQSVAVLAITSNKKVVVARQFRAGREFYCYDLPGGAVESGESLEVAARRELFEETGYAPGSMKYLGEYSWDGYGNLTSTYFIALDCSLEGSHRQDQEESDQGAEAVLISISELINHAKNNKVTDAAAILYAYDTLKEIERGQDETTN